MKSCLIWTVGKSCWMNQGKNISLKLCSFNTTSCEMIFPKASKKSLVLTLLNLCFATNDTKKSRHGASPITWYIIFKITAVLEYVMALNIDQTSSGVSIYSALRVIFDLETWSKTFQHSLCVKIITWFWSRKIFIDVKIILPNPVGSCGTQAKISKKHHRSLLRIFIPDFWTWSGQFWDNFEHGT